MRNRANWWAIIPSVALFVAAIVVFLDWLAPDVADVWSGAILLGGIAAGFVAVYLVERQNWWSLIPAGVLLTLAVITVTDQLITGVESSGILFLGFGLTFGLLAMLPNVDGGMKWAWIPAILLSLVGLIFLLAIQNFWVYILPDGLILVGLFLFMCVFRNR